MKPKRQFSGIVANGHLPPAQKSALLALLSRMEGKRMLITVEEIKRRRSLNQNAFYWGVVIPFVQQMFTDAGTDIDEEQVHEYLKIYVAGIKSVIVDPAGIRRSVVGSTAKMSTVDFEIFLDKVRAWAAQFGYQVPFPNEEDSKVPEYDPETGEVFASPPPVSPDADHSHGDRRPQPVSSPETEKAPAFFNKGN